MTAPLALDLMCCGGGSSEGLRRAGFRVIGVDHKRQKEYPHDFLLRDLSTADAIRAVIDEVRPDFVSSSPPCQQFSSATPTHAKKNHPNLLPACREAITSSGIPGWIENVAGAPLHHPIMLCGSMFAETKRLRRHRFFDLLGWFTLEPAHEHCTFAPEGVYGDGRPTSTVKRAIARRAIESVHNGSPGTNTRKRIRRETTTVQGHGAGGEAYKRMRSRVVVSINDGNTVPPAFQHDRGNPIAVAFLEKNSAGPECIRWREAMGWLDGPKNRYCLAQAVPPAYAEWLGRAFLASRRPT